MDAAGRASPERGLLGGLAVELRFDANEARGEVLQARPELVGSFVLLDEGRCDRGCEEGEEGDAGENHERADRAALRA